MNFIVNNNDKEKILENLLKIDTFFNKTNFNAQKYVELVKNGKFGGICVFSDIPNTSVRLAVHINEVDVTTSFVPSETYKTQDFIIFRQQDKMKAFLEDNNAWNVPLSFFNNWETIKEAIFAKVRHSQHIYFKLYGLTVE